jgi:hypothetical protein
VIWKIIFWGYSVIYLSIVILSSLEVKWKIVDWIGVFAVLMGLFILYAYAYNKNYWSKNTRTLIVLMIVAYWSIYSFYLDSKYGAYPGKELSDSIFNTLLLSPIFIAGTLYIRRAKG